MYNFISSLIQLLLRALELYEEKAREGELQSLAKERRKLEEEMSNAKNADELSDVINNWSNGKLSTNESTTNTKSTDVDNSTQT